MRTYGGEMTDDKLLDDTEAAHRLWQDTPRWRWLLRLRRENAWLALCAELQEREVRAARERQGYRHG